MRLPEYEAMDNRADALYRKLLALVDNGEINERKTSFWMNWIPEI
mgnify:CR=1 FL=1